MPSELQLCSNCPAGEKLKREAIKRLKDRQYVLKEEPSTIKVCIELRIIMRANGIKCPYYTKAENIFNFL